MRKNKGKPFGLGWLIILSVATCAAAGTGTYYMVSSSKSNHNPVEHNRSIVVVEPDANTDAPDSQQQASVSDQVKESSRKVVIYLPKSSANGAYLSPSTRTTDEKGDILDIAVRALLDSNKTTADGVYLVPKGTRLLSQIKVKSGIATVDLSKEFVNNFTGGSDQEALTLNSIAHTVVNNSDEKVEKVRILVEGKTVESLGGHFDLTEPIVADSTMLKPGN